MTICLKCLAAGWEFEKYLRLAIIEIVAFQPLLARTTKSVEILFNQMDFDFI